MNLQDEDQVKWDKKLFKKIVLWVVLTIFVALALLYLFANHYPQFVQYLEKRRDARMEKIISETNAKLDTAYRADTEGGKTPEETLDLEIAALKQNNIELASKYYSVITQEKAKKNLEDELKQFGNLNNSISYLNDLKIKGTKKCVSDGCNISYYYITDKEETIALGNLGDKLTIPKGGQREKSLDFEQSKYTKVWKIIEP